jgi:hypothetical protein
MMNPASDSFKVQKRDKFGKQISSLVGLRARLGFVLGRSERRRSTDRQFNSERAILALVSYFGGCRGRRDE